MAWRLSRSVESLRTEVNKAFPDRSKVSDGTIGDAAHSARTSDHNPDAQGLVKAWDVTADPERGVAQSVVDFLIRSRDLRVKYIIWQGQIMSGSAGPSPWVWRKYTGPNGHFHHAHISFYGDNPAPWGFTSKPAAPSGWQGPPFPGVILPGAVSPRVQQWAVLLSAAGYRGFNVTGQAGTVYGKGKELATRRFQKRHGLKVDGVVGPQTWAAAVASVAEKKRKANAK